MPPPSRTRRTTSNPVRPVKPRGWTDVFSDELVRIGHRRPDVVAITAAMLHPTGLAAFAQEFPDRIFDVGIAEQHAVTSAAGLAMGGLHPVVGLYATFSTERSTNCCSTSRCTSAASPSCSTVPVSPVTTARATTACGTCRSRSSSRPPARRPARRQAAGKVAQRGGRRVRRPDRTALCQGRGVPGYRGDRADRRARRA